MPGHHLERAALVFHLGTFHLREPAPCRVPSCGVVARRRVVVRANRIAVLDLCETHARQVEAFVGTGCQKIQLGRMICDGSRISATQNTVYETRGRDTSRMPCRGTATMGTL